ncbi:MAG: acyltransferase [Gordonia sp.]|nr:acyltransferase [Gordonia sp. (in: high G+C Gram-positive bacteria)]
MLGSTTYFSATGQVRHNQLTASPSVESRPPSVPADTVPSYRTDLDGLRGLAIVLVACFHIWFGRVSGGVDVFLTLSGYFFVGSLLRHVIVSQDDRATLWHTVDPTKRLTRLARRLLPALVAILIVISLGTLLIFPQTRWVSTGKEVIASLFYYQNWHLAFNSQDYTAASSANSPLQHLWSMSVQGQFFVITMLTALVFAGAIKLLVRAGVTKLADPTVIRVVVFLAILGVAAVSFYWAHMRMEVNQQFNYYDTISRAWEPLAGGLLAIWMPKWRVPNVIRSLVAIVALGMIITCGWWIVGVEQYPGPWALVPVLSTLAIIWAGATGLQHGPKTDQPMVNQGLSTRQMVWLGSISYALYLWHWPLLIFYLTWRDKNHASIVEGTVLIAVSIAMAWLTKRYIEEPLRAPRSVSIHKESPPHKGSPTRHHHAAHAAPVSPWRERMLNYTTVVTTMLVVGAILMTAGFKAWDYHVEHMTVDTTNLDPRVYPGARALLENAPVPHVDPQPSPLQVVKDLPATSFNGHISDFKDDGVHVGVYGDPLATKTIALAGGSHAEMWITALDAIGKQNHFKIKTYLKMGCPLSTELVPKQAGVPYPQCHDWVEKVVPQIIADKPDAVFTNSTRPRDYEPGDWVPDDYLPIFDQFGEAGIPVLGIRDTSWPHNGAGSINTPDCLSNNDVDECSTSRASSFAATNPTLDIVQEHPNVLPLDLTDGMCTETQCPAVVGNIIVYHDLHHLSATFVRSLIPELQRQMQAALPWT